MAFIKSIIFTGVLGYLYFLITISMIGIASARKIFWWFDWQDNFHFYHIAQNFFGIGLAALLPAYLIFCYERTRMWMVSCCVILFSMLFQGNINAFIIDPIGIYRFLHVSLFYGDIGSIGVFLEILVLPFFWLWIFKCISKSQWPNNL